MIDGLAARVPPPWTAIRAIALNTFREAIRDRILYLLLVFALVLIGSSRVISLMTVGDENKIIKDIGLSAISIFGVLTAVFVGVSLVFKEIERRTIYTLLANPVRRWQFVTGKFFGLLAVLALNVTLMSVALFALLGFRGASPWGLLPAVLMIGIELTIITAVALLFSSVTNPILAAVATAATYVMGHLAWSLQLLKARVDSVAGSAFCDLVYWVVPGFDRLDIKTEAVHGITLPSGFLPLAIAYGLGYAAVVLFVACVLFERRDFS